MAYLALAIAGFALWAAWENEKEVRELRNAIADYRRLLSDTAGEASHRIERVELKNHIERGPYEVSTMEVLKALEDD